MSTYYGYWDCTTCGNLKNLGPYTHCTGCGASRPKDVKFYLPENEAEITDEDRISEAENGPDWSCSNCGSHNKIEYDHCKTCGSHYREEDRDTILSQREYDENNVPRDGRVDRNQGRTVAPDPKVKPGRGRKMGIFATILAAIGAFFATFSSTIEVNVVGFEWERTLYAEAYKYVQEEDWELPSDGKLVNSFRALHHYDKKFVRTERRTRTVREAAGTEQYVCGKIDQGNGYFTDKYCTRTIYRNREESYDEDIYEEIPVYKTKYAFMVWRWKEVEPIKTQGNDHSPKWGAALEPTEKFRVTKKEESYHITVQDHNGENHREKMHFAQWERLKNGEKLEAEISTFYRYYKGLKR